METGGGAEIQAEAADEPFRNRAEDDAGGPTTVKPLTEEGPNKAPTEGPLKTPTKGGPEAEGERYAAMKAMPPNVLSVGDRARRPAISSKPKESR